MATELYDPTENSCLNDLCFEMVDKKTAIMTIASLIIMSGTAILFLRLSSIVA
jgi:hypothetical protein